MLSHFPAFLVLAEPVAILEAPGNQGFVEGDRAELVCKAMGAPLPTIVWKKSSTVLENSDRIQIFVNQSTESLLVTSRLVISSVSTYDAGQYYCVASNTLSQGELSSDEVFFSLVIQSKTARSLFIYLHFAIQVCFLYREMGKLYCLHVHLRLLNIPK